MTRARLMRRPVRLKDHPPIVADMLTIFRAVRTIPEPAHERFIAVVVDCLLEQGPDRLARLSQDLQRVLTQPQLKG